MEKSGLLISARNINPIPCISDYKKVRFLCKNFNFSFKKHPLSFCSPFMRRMLNTKCSTSSSIGIINAPTIEIPLPHHAHGASQFLEIVNIPNIADRVLLMDLDPATAKLGISLLGPFLSAFGFLFIVRIVMSWYPKLPVEKFPYVIAYAPTEPILGPTRKRRMLNTKCSTASSIGIINAPTIEIPLPHHAHGASQFLEIVNIPNIADRVFLMDLDPATAKLGISLLGPFLSAFGFLFIVRIVMSWYPKLPVEKFPYVIAYAPTEPILGPTRKVIPPLAGVDVTPVIWFGLISFLSEILVGPQGLLVLLSQKV